MGAVNGAVRGAVMGAVTGAMMGPMMVVREGSESNEGSIRRPVVSGFDTLTGISLHGEETRSPLRTTAGTGLMTF